MEQLPFADGSFDAVIAANSIQYAADRIAALASRLRADGSIRFENVFRYVVATV